MRAPLLTQTGGTGCEIPTPLRTNLESEPMFAQALFP